MYVVNRPQLLVDMIRITRGIRVVSPREKPNLPNSIRAAVLPACRERHTAWPRACARLSPISYQLESVPWESSASPPPFFFFLSRVNRPSFFGNPSYKVHLSGGWIGRLSGGICTYVYIRGRDSGLGRKGKMILIRSSPCQRVRIDADGAR